MIIELQKLFNKKSGSKKILKKFDLIGRNILQKTFDEINLSLKNEI